MTPRDTATEDDDREFLEAAERLLASYPDAARRYGVYRLHDPTSTSVVDGATTVRLLDPHPDSKQDSGMVAMAGQLMESTVTERPDETHTACFGWQVVPEVTGEPGGEHSIHHVRKCLGFINPHVS